MQLRVVAHQAEVAGVVALGIGPIREGQLEAQLTAVERFRPLRRGHMQDRQRELDHARTVTDSAPVANDG